METELHLSLYHILFWGEEERTGEGGWKAEKKKRTHIHSTKHKHTSDAFREYKNNRNQNSLIITNNKICETLTVRTHWQTDKQAKKKKELESNTTRELRHIFKYISRHAVSSFVLFLSMYAAMKKVMGAPSA